TRASPRRSTAADSGSRGSGGRVRGVLAPGAGRSERGGRAEEGPGAWDVRLLLKGRELEEAGGEDGIEAGVRRAPARDEREVGRAGPDRVGVEPGEESSEVEEPGWGLEAGVSSEAAPGPFFGTLDDPGCDRIEVDVADSVPVVRFRLDAYCIGVV